MGWYEDAEIEAENEAAFDCHEAGTFDGWHGNPRDTSQYNQEAYDMGYRKGAASREARNAQ
jgi:hypothetical protein